jgi:hypothetical protein
MGVLVYGGLQGIWWAGKGRQARAISGSPFIYPLNTGTKDHLARCWLDIIAFVECSKLL